MTTEGSLGLGFDLILDLILDGEASVSQGGSQLRRLGPGDHFGEVSRINGWRRSATVTAGVPLRAAQDWHATFEELLDQDPGFARGLLEVLCARLREAESCSSARPALTYRSCGSAPASSCSGSAPPPEISAA